MSEGMDELGAPIDTCIQRRKVWRNTVVLFHTYNTLNGRITGPFHGAGYKKYVIDSPMPSKARSDDYTPDVIAWDEERNLGLIVEITRNPNGFDRKQNQLGKYRTDMDIQGITTFGGNAANGYNVILSHPHLYNNKQKRFCEIAVDDIFQIQNEDILSDVILREKLCDFRSHSFSINVPEIPIMLFPEMRAVKEVRASLVAQVMSLFRSDAVGMTAEEFTNNSLERLKDKITPAAKEKLVDSVRIQLSILVKTYLGKYLAYDEASEKFQKVKPDLNIISNSKAKTKIMKQLQDWIEDKSPTPIPDDQVTLSNFLGDSEEINWELDDEDLDEEEMEERIGGLLQ